MGFGFRKSFGSGPFRFTVSPSGVSSSFGVKGARVTSGPRGTFVTVSSHGIYYRHRMNKESPRPQVSSQPKVTEQQQTLDSVFNVPIAELASSTQDELIARLNEKASATNPAIFVGLLSIIGLLLFSSYPGIGLLIVLVVVIASAVISHRFSVSNRHSINYSLEDQESKRFAIVLDALSSLESCSSIWTLNTQTATSDQKRNAGASTLITRKPASVGFISTKGLRASVPFKSISANGAVFHFLPDQILVFRDGRYGSISYTQLRVVAVATRFIENESVPRDSTQVDTTWKYVNKGGGPDRRFNNNRQLPILRYGEVTLQTAGGLHVILQASSYDKANIFARQISGGLPVAAQTHQDAGSAKPFMPEAERSLLQCYELLGITRPSSLEQAAIAHRHQSMLYHPDRYEHLAPEMKALAMVKMQEINAAYSRVKFDISSN